MTARIQVVGRCARPCPSCVACEARAYDTSLDEALALLGNEKIILGGGDATSWRHLREFLSANEQSENPAKVWLEAPAITFFRDKLSQLREMGIAGLVVQIEAAGPKVIQTLGVGDGEDVIRRAEELGFETEARICARPKTFSALVGLAKRLSPRRVWLELIRQDWGSASVPMWPDSIGKALTLCSNISFGAQRLNSRGYLPPCAIPDVWESRPTAWRSVLETRPEPNTVLPSCTNCSLAKECHWNDRGALAEEVVRDVKPIQISKLPWDRSRVAQRAVPVAIVQKRRTPEVICTAPWTTMEIVDPDGKVRQCCTTWTEGDRGNVFDQSLLGVWNGPGYRFARRVMSGQDVSPLCNPICSRLYDKKFGEREFSIQQGSDAFVKNQLLMAEEIAERREVVQSKPLRLALCPSTYCNYDCIMCVHGRTPRRDLPTSIWDELPEIVPTLQTLTFLGGEPLANPYTMKFLREFDMDRWPDTAIDIVTNGSLLTENALRHMSRCSLGSVIVSVNAGTADVYARVQRGLDFSVWLANLDALIRFRANHRRHFQITLSFVVQPAAAHTLIQFGEIARARNLDIRLMALNAGAMDELDFYKDADEVARVIEHLDAFDAWARRVRPAWANEIRAARFAVMGEARARKEGIPPAVGGTNPRRLPVLA